MSDAASRQIAYDANKKSPWVAALLNLVLPGAGYIYCGSVALGIVAMLFSGVLLVVTLGIAGFILYPILIVDGVFAAGRTNKKLAEQLTSGTAIT